MALTLCEGMLLDGQERRKACLVTGADPMFEEYVVSDPAGYLLRTNVFRRQLTQSQITMAVVELRQSAPPGRPRNAKQRAGFSDDVHQFTSNELAIESGSSNRYVRMAKRVAREGLSHRVHSGEISINAANQLISDRAALEKKTTPGKPPKWKASTRQHTEEVMGESMAEIVKVSRILGQSQEQTATLRDEFAPLRALLQGVQDVTSTVAAADGCACPLLQELNLLLERAQMLPPENGAQPVMEDPKLCLVSLPSFQASRWMDSPATAKPRSMRTSRAAGTGSRRSNNEPRLRPTTGRTLSNFTTRFPKTAWRRQRPTPSPEQCPAQELRPGCSPTLWRKRAGSCRACTWLDGLGSEPASLLFQGYVV